MAQSDGNNDNARNAWVVITNGRKQKIQTDKIHYVAAKIYFESNTLHRAILWRGVYSRDTYLHIHRTRYCPNIFGRRAVKNYNFKKLYII